jgi:hypothetical protein
MTQTTTTIARPAPPRRDDAKPRLPHTAYMREFTMLGGRKILIDKRLIGFICEGKPEDFDGKQVTVVAWKGWAKPCASHRKLPRC